MCEHSRVYNLIKCIIIIIIIIYKCCTVILLYNINKSILDVYIFMLSIIISSSSIHHFIKQFNTRRVALNSDILQIIMYFIYYLHSIFKPSMQNRNKPTLTHTVRVILQYWNDR